MTAAPLYALDFDGVICDSAIETGLTGWKAACIVWPDMPTDMPDGIMDKFRHIRPAMETGYEAILIMRFLFEGGDADLLLNNFGSQIAHLIRRDEIDIDRLKNRFGSTRDEWIKEDLDDWIAKNPLFDGIQSKLQQLDPATTYIITTKQERFVSQIFESNDIDFPAEHIFGLDRKLSKQQVLKDLLIKYPEQDILFVEDRLPTLHNVIKDENLQQVRLFFANWGYNTQADKTVAKEIGRLNSINLDEMLAL